MEELIFNDDWMEREPLHTHVVDATGQLLAEHCYHDRDRIESVSGMIYHFMSCWYHAILEANGALVQPAVRACALFTAHMVEEHGMPPDNQFGCVALLTRFTALVITRSGGKLL